MKSRQVRPNSAKKVSFDEISMGRQRQRFLRRNENLESKQGHLVTWVHSGIWRSWKKTYSNTLTWCLDCNSQKLLCWWRWCRGQWTGCDVRIDFTVICIHNQHSSKKGRFWQHFKCASYLAPLHHHVGVCLTLSLVLLSLPEQMLIDKKGLEEASLMIVSTITRGEGREFW